MQIGVDIGGTFTDIVALDGEGRLTLTKVPSTPKDLLEGIGAAVQRVLTLAGAAPDDVERFIHGTTVATNAILEQKGAVTAVLATDGFDVAGAADHYAVGAGEIEYGACFLGCVDITIGEDGNANRGFDVPDCLVFGLAFSQP